MAKTIKELFEGETKACRVYIALQKEELEQLVKNKKVSLDNTGRDVYLTVCSTMGINPRLKATRGSITRSVKSIQDKGVDLKALDQLLENNPEAVKALKEKLKKE